MALGSDYKNATPLVVAGGGGGAYFGYSGVGGQVTLQASGPYSGTQFNFIHKLTRTLFKSLLS